VKALAEQTYYELLEAPFEGTPQQIERAYRIARATYAPTSTATYSLFSSDESASILRRIEEAYAVLSDARLRREYDARLRRVDPRPGAPTAPAAAPARVAPPVRPAAQVPLRTRPEPSRDDAAELDGGLAPENGVFDGDVLRRIRLSLGIELEEIVATTKINEHHLRSIEANRYEVLPPPVYLRGFLRQIAKCLSLDPAAVSDSYTARMRESSAKPR